ncbi:hypothetical protein HJG53_11865 [Sphingomonas sp. ID1715]|uniref:hypothetical protein n=1 Tax=Sphingomonas sp. ID1715 TaxID=1656898 RepID=UPI001488EC57|nr:hypothetical protein [Sphingomonas sp. ID1715]NNM77606.1 hypothetical protein [Sphingomonas sp. ID1715]
MRIVTKAVAAAVAAALCAGSATAACWTDAAYAAAQVRELDTMLMVQALRCRKTNANFVEGYNRFVVASRPALLKANATLKGHFAEEFGERGALNAYDNYMTTVANRYGAGTVDMDCEDAAALVEMAAAAKGNAASLQEVAEIAQMTPNLQGRRCLGGGSPLTIASRR